MPNDPRQFDRNALLLLAYGFLKAFKPSEPFLVPYLTQEKDLTREQIQLQVFPIWTYAFFLWIVPLVLFAHCVGDRAALWLAVFAGHLATRVLLLFGEGVHLDGGVCLDENRGRRDGHMIGLFWMQVMQVTFALAIAGEIVFYASVWKLSAGSSSASSSSSSSRGGRSSSNHNNVLAGRRMMAWSQAAILTGHSCGALLGQCLVTFTKVEFRFLFWISLASVVLAAAVSLFLPSVQVGRELFVNSDASLFRDEQQVKRKEDDEEQRLLLPDSGGGKGRIVFEEDPEMDGEVPTLPPTTPTSLLGQRMLTLLPLLLLFSLHKAHLYNVEAFSSVLWDRRLEDEHQQHDRWKLWHGLADASSRGLASLASILVGRFVVGNMVRFRPWLVVAFSAMVCGGTWLEARIPRLAVAYSMYALVVGWSGALLALCSAWMAEQGSWLVHERYTQSYAPLFGLATLVASGTQCALVAVLTGWLRVEVLMEFQVFAWFSVGILGLALGVALLYGSKRA